MTYIIVADWGRTTNKITAENRAPDIAKAQAMQRSMVKEGYSDAFFAELPDVYGSGWGYVDPVAKTVFFDQVKSDADALASSWVSLRTERNALLASSDWTQYTDSPLDDEAKAEWVVYREELRDLPESVDPADPTWPEAP